jgi:hypothetical protein
MKETSPPAIGLFVAMTAALLLLGVWMLVVERKAAGLLPLVFALFNIAIGIASRQWSSRR